MEMNKQSFEVNFQSSATKAENKVYLVNDKLKLPKELEKNVQVKSAIAQSKFDGKRKKTVSIFEGNTRIILVGTGEEKPKNPEKANREIGGEIQQCLNGIRAVSASVISHDAVSAANMAYGALLKGYTFMKYFTKKKDDEKPSLKTLSFAVPNEKQAKEKFAPLKAIADSVYLARNYVTEPPNVIYPESYANSIKKELTKVGAKVEILGVAEMTKLGMGSLLGVGQGSVKESKLVIIQYNGSKKKNDKPIAFVGKGVCFDTGGISIKPSDGMEDMKYDMGGSAAVVGVMHALASRKAKVNAVGIVGLVENMPDGNAQRPSDIVKSMSGQTIEVLNTDAEGRLVLADALWYCQDRFDPKFMIDLATLTGAVVVALGQHKAGLMSNDDKLADQLYKAGEEVGENLWRLPLGEEYDKQIDSKIADVQNISNMKGGGTITAGQFLKRFVNDKKWAHLDIAGTAWATKDKPLVPINVATGFGVQLLDRLVSNHYED